MNLDDKLNLQFTKFSLKSPNPKQDHPWFLRHLNADFIELRTLFWDNSSFVTIQDAISFYKDNSIEIKENKDGKLEDEMSSSNDEIWYRKFLEIFSILEERDVVFEEDYPFNYENDKLKLKDELSANHKLYLYLLISSNLNNFKTLQDVITSEFERFSKEALQQYLPEFVVEEFGRNSTYSGNTINKIKKLAAILNIDINNKGLQNIPKTASQDKGLDIVGWRSFKDEIASMIIILGQCACGKDWVNKKSETSYYKDSYLCFRKIEPLYAMFVPYALVHNNQEFYQNDKTNSKLIFERKRMLDMVMQRIEVFKNSDSFTIVERCIAEDAIEV